MKRAASDRGMKRAASDRGLWFEDCSPVQYPRKCWKAIENDKSAPKLPEALVVWPRPVHLSPCERLPQAPHA